MLVVLAPIVVFTLIIAFMLWLFGPRAPIPTRIDPSGVRTVAAIDMPESAPLPTELRSALEKRGVTVEATEEQWATHLDVTRERERFAIELGWVGDDDAKWTLYVEARAPRAACELVHDALREITPKVRWSSVQTHATGRADWRDTPVD